MISDEDDFSIRPTRRGQDPAPTGGSWWATPLCHESRSEFSAEIATRFALNKAETDSAGLAQWSKPVKPREAA